LDDEFFGKIDLASEGSWQDLLPDRWKPTVSPEDQNSPKTRDGGHEGLPIHTNTSLTLAQERRSFETTSFCSFYYTTFGHRRKVKYQLLKS